MKPIRSLRILVMAAALAMPGLACAQAYRCAVPGAIPPPRTDGPSPREPRRMVPIGSYTLAITWGPQFCRERADSEAGRFQCGQGNRFGFTLHGLWPDGASASWPQYCAPAPILSQDTLRRNLCATPSAQLLQHEYAKHGTCMGIAADRYFARSTALYGRLRYPDMNALSRRPTLTAGQLATAFARANRGMTAAMMRIIADRRGWLDEIWLCLDTRFRPRTCPAHQGGLRPGAPLRIWRGGS